MGRRRKRSFIIYIQYGKEERKRKMGEFYKMIWIKNKKKDLKKLKKKRCG